MIWLELRTKSGERTKLAGAITRLRISGRRPEAGMEDVEGKRQICIGFALFSRSIPHFCDYWQARRTKEERGRKEE